ncbi:R3H domain-containing nucleic acid-binding protein [Tepidiforma sp.]|uniref:R3H domain-containing nucleic acid-binding protein n=1 Tax=Tepidiforma sp. TaxID=2682230 RepID=UPI0021DEF8AC|nr:R3H domain-containing nucleic acid-binding protein [Tepidiforma sp.]MCX7618961.1 AAA family ATPase [Tepidiforma sp.]GIW18981.1 MAG: single-stranded DNA-binding protein [Tepidiforma sp.]
MSQSSSASAPLPPEQIVTDDLDLLLDALPPHISGPLREAERRADLLEVVMDLGRLPEARYPGREVILSREEVTEADLQWVIARIGDFGDDNRAGIERTLHRISCIRNRRGKVIGLTCRVGRAVYGTIRVIEDLVLSGKNILLLGRPGVGKTTMLREVARVLADDANKRVIIVDTSNEIGGDGDVPHPAIGGSRRMQVATPSMQHAVMIEAVENHMPEVIVIDEIGTELEAQAARTIAERGVQLVGTAHGTSLENLMLNPTLADLIGGIQSVTLGDEEARRRGTQKSILERKAPPTFDIVVEIESWRRVAIHKNVAETVDAILRGYRAKPETRQLGPGGRIEIVDDADREGGEFGMGAPAPARPGRPPTWEIGHRRNGGHIREFREPREPRGFEPAPAEPAEFDDDEPPQFAAPALRPASRITRIFPFGIPRARLEQAARSVDANIELVDDPADADAVITLRNYYRSKPPALREAEERNLPLYVVKSSGVYQLEQALLQLRGDRGSSGARGPKRDPMVDVFRETEEAIAKVLEEGRPVELPPANSYIRRVQHQLATRYNLESRSSGKEPMRRVKILPLGSGTPFER